MACQTYEDVLARVVPVQLMTEEDQLSFMMDDMAYDPDAAKELWLETRYADEIEWEERMERGYR